MTTEGKDEFTKTYMKSPFQFQDQILILPWGLQRAVVQLTFHHSGEKEGAASTGSSRRTCWWQNQTDHWPDWFHFTAYTKVLQEAAILSFPCFKLIERTSKALIGHLLWKDLEKYLKQQCEYPVRINYKICISIYISERILHAVWQGHFELITPSSSQTLMHKHLLQQH